MSIQIPALSIEEIQEAIRNYLGTNEFVLNKYDVQQASETPLGFMGDHLNITVEVVTNGNDQKIQLFTKIIPTKVQTHYEYVHKTGCFYKEIELYKTLITDIIKAMESDKKWVPKFCYSRGSDILVVENVAVKGYYMLSERTLMDMEHMKIAIESLASMHAGTIIFEENLNKGKTTTMSPHYIRGKTSTIWDLYQHLLYETEASDVKGHPGNKFWEAGFRSLPPLVDALPIFTPQQKKMMKEVLPINMRRAFDYVKPSQKFKKVLLHGDLWANNILFRKDNNGAVSNAIIVDFQMARYGAPMQDLLMLIYQCQNRQFRQENERELFDLYYNKLSTVLAGQSIDISLMLPRQEFDDSIQHYREYAVINNLMNLPLILVPSKITGTFLSSPELFYKNMLDDRSEMLLACFKEDELCRTRITEMFLDAAETYQWK